MAAIAAVDAGVMARDVRATGSPVLVVVLPPGGDRPGVNAVLSMAGPVRAGQTEKELPQPHEPVALGLLKTNPRFVTSSLKSMIVFSR